MAKQIQVSDEMYEFLMDLSKKLNTQGHRATRMPYIFQVQEQKLVPAIEGNGEEYWCGEEGIMDEESVEEMVKEYQFEKIQKWVESEEKDEGEDYSEYIGLSDEEIEEELTNWYEMLGGYEIKQIMEDELGHYRIWLEEKPVLSQAFFTEAACLKHIEADRHNLRKPVSFLSGLSHRNPEMEQLMTFLCEISGGKLHT